MNLRMTEDQLWHIILFGLVHAHSKELLSFLLLELEQQEKNSF